MYSTAPLFADATVDAHMVTTNNFGLLTQFAGQDKTLGFIAAVVLDSSDAVVEGAAISSTPSCDYKYTGGLGIPSDGTGTASDGQAYFVNVPAGPVEISATKSGITFHSHTLKAHPGAMTTTTIAP
jgi:hypothetical protein